MLNLTNGFRIQIRTLVGYRFSPTKLAKIKKKLITHSLVRVEANRNFY